MSFDNDRRKDHRKPYLKSKRFDRSCRVHGSCGCRCRSNREHATKQREQAAEEKHDCRDHAGFGCWIPFPAIPAEGLGAR